MGESLLLRREFKLPAHVLPEERHAQVVLLFTMFRSDPRGRRWEWRAMSELEHVGPSPGTCWIGRDGRLQVKSLNPKSKNKRRADPKSTYKSISCYLIKTWEKKRHSSYTVVQTFTPHMRSISPAIVNKLDAICSCFRQIIIQKWQEMSEMWN